MKSLGDALTDILNVESCEVLVRDEQTRQLMVAYPIAGDPGRFAPDVTRTLDQLGAPVLASELDADHSPLAGLFAARGWESASARTNDRLNGGSVSCAQGPLISRTRTRQSPQRPRGAGSPARSRTCALRQRAARNRPRASQPSVLGGCWRQDRAEIREPWSP